MNNLLLRIIKIPKREDITVYFRKMKNSRFSIPKLLHPRLIVYILLLFNLVNIAGQDSTSYDQNESDRNIIQWIGQYPDVKNDKNDGFKSKLGDIVFGKKANLIIKPITVIASDPEHFWILDQGNGMLVEKEFNKGKIPNQFSRRDEPFSSLVGLCFLSNDELLFTDSRENQIFKFTQGNKNLEILNDTLKLQQPTGIAYSTLTGEICVLETGAHRVSVLSEQGELIRRFGKRGNTPGNFNFPTHIWIDSSGKIYIVDAMNFRIQIFNSKGEFLLEFGEAGDATGYLARPKGIATDSMGNIYIADALFHTVQIFDKEGKFLYYFGSQGAEKGQFWMPSGIFIDSNNYIYVADSYNARVQVFKLVIKNL